MNAFPGFTDPEEVRRRIAEVDRMAELTRLAEELSRRASHAVPESARVLLTAMHALMVEHGVIAGKKGADC